MRSQSSAGPRAKGHPYTSNIPLQPSPMASLHFFPETSHKSEADEGLLLQLPATARRLKTLRPEVS